MLKNYLIVAFRNLWKNKGFSAINIAGLAVGLATCLLILFFVLDELGYDRYNEKADRIYRVDADLRFGGNHFVLAVDPDPMGPTLKKDYPEVEQYVRFRGYWNSFLVRKDNQNIQENNVIYADSTLFDVFTLPMIQGDPKTALVAPSSVVITESVARRYFNTDQAVGRVLTVNDSVPYKVTGVIRDMPTQSHFHFDIFISMASNPDSRQNIWVSNNYNTYIVLRKGADPKRLDAQFDGLVDRYLMPQAAQILNISADAFRKQGNFAHYMLTPLTSIHLHSNKTAELGANGDIQYIYIFSAAALFILLIACVNFMNLSTARSAGRAKEVGVRKTLGSLRQNLIGQFLTESILVSLMSLVLAMLLVELALGSFNHLAGKDMQLHLLDRPGLIGVLLGIALVVGLLAGAYPAFYLSSFRPIKVLKGVLSTGFRTGWLRSTLVVFQFSISIFLIVGTVVIYNQLQFIRHKDVGFNREQVLIVSNTQVLGKQATVFRNELLRLGGVEDVTVTGYLPTSSNRDDNPLFQDATLDPKKAISLQIWGVDEHYIPTLGMRMSEGRNFSSQFPTDSIGIIVNEAAVRLLGTTRPLDKNLYALRDFRGGNAPGNVQTLHIIGVVKDFNFNSLREVVTPLALYVGSAPGGVAIRMHTNDLPGLLDRVRNLWTSMAPSQPFSYSFMDDDFNRIYASEQRMGGIALFFASLAIFVACLGLFGLVTYAAEQRTKEVGIRKVLGASVANIVTLLSRDFLGLVVVSLLIAFPLAWWAMHHWLEDFAYHVSIGWWVFAASGAMALLIALGTVSFQAIKAALANPVKSLRTE
ncbi:ABC transporter permease [Dinghuibacter silviterrae]|uniref:Putative ABC transport system permease protein n=1 Tax=Dinghuibacter silviterrae TaxID=1539049 RepID=A0A4R8DI39_9BACT|nr:ABC transporter permease [Dinghuibacter silviterrae]TDW97409.1 putative ABC transport system permease protein [Dinghuibacter silviterrae]